MQEIADTIEQISDRATQANVAASTYILAGLVLQTEVIQKVLRTEIMRESVTYQEIEAQGLRKGLQREPLSLVLRQLTRRVEKLPVPLPTQINGLSLEQLENLGEELLDSKGLTDLEAWLAQQ